ADQVVPMLPPLLSNHVCSLRPGVPRLTLSAFLRYDADGTLVDTRLSESWIVSRVKLSYQAAERLLAGDEPEAGHFATHSTEESGELRSRFAQEWDSLRVPLRAALADMRQLARTLRRRRFAAGSLDIDTPEYKVVHDERGRAVRVEERQDLESYQLVEEF